MNAQHSDVLKTLRLQLTIQTYFPLLHECLTFRRTFHYYMNAQHSNVFTILRCSTFRHTLYSFCWKPDFFLCELYISVFGWGLPSPCKPPDDGTFCEQLDTFGASWFNTDIIVHCTRTACSVQCSVFLKRVLKFRNKLKS